MQKGVGEMNRGIIWDLDGVIVDSAPFHLEAWQKFTAVRGIVFTHRDFKRTFGMKNEDIFVRIFGEELERGLLKIWSDEKEERFRQLIQGKVKPFPGVRTLLRNLDTGGYKQAVASSAPLKNIHLILDTLTITDFFNTIISGEEVAMGKPHPEAFLKAAKGMSLIHSRCLVIEDAVAGIEAAKSVGMKAIGVTNTLPGGKLASADLVVRSLEEVDLKMIDQLLI
ncbi:MAG: HAD family phosphatase [Syntrophobacterales bacterium]|nr:MAG: HAD family phosphatase [Syntrophobacterales bacterium]